MSFIFPHQQRTVTVPAGQSIIIGNFKGAYLQVLNGKVGQPRAPVYRVLQNTTGELIGPFSVNVELVVINGSETNEYVVGVSPVLTSVEGGGSSTGSTLYQRILAASQSAQADTAHPSPPTVTFGASGDPSTISGGGSITVPNILLNDVRIGKYGCPKILGSGGFYYPVSARMFLSSAITDKGTGFEFVTDAADVDFVTVPRGDGAASIRIYVDDQFISDATSGANNGDYPNTTGASALYCKLAFGSSKPGGRKIRVMGNINAKFLGINVTPLASVWLPTVKRIKMSYTSDSFGSDRNWLNLNSGMFQRAGQALGVEPVGSAIAGTGYIVNGSAANFITRAQDMTLFTDTDLHIIAGGCNDFAQDPTALRTAVSTYILNVRGQLPATVPIIVLNAWFSKSQAITAPIQAAILGGYTDAVAAGAKLVYSLDNLAEGWVYGTGYSGAPTGNGNADLYVGTDQLHPTLALNAGHDFLGAMLARGILRTLKAAGV